MLVVVTHGPKDYRVEEVPVPVPGPGEVLIEVGAVGICASDMKCWLGGPLGRPPRRGRRREAPEGEKKGGVGYVEAPCIAGHEYAGRIGTRRRRFRST